VTVTFDTSVLLGWYQSQATLSGLAARAGAGGSSATAATAAAVPSAPWNSPSTQPKDPTLVSNALTGKPFIDEKSAKLDVPTADADYKKLFAMNQGLLTLQALANAANDPTTPSFKLTQIQQAFDRGMSELSSYVSKSKFDNFRLTEGAVTTSASSTAGVTTASDTYVTDPLVAGSADTAVPAFQGATQFTMTVNRPQSGAVPAKTTTVTFDLSEMGATPRTMNNVAAYMNSKLSAAAVGVRVGVNRTDTDPQTMTVNGQTVTISPSKAEYGFKISGLKSESVSLSAPTTAPAVYVAQTAGNPDPDGNASTADGATQQELVKLETGSGADGVRRPDDQNYVAGRVFSQQLPANVGAVHATATGADGSVYMLADATGPVNGQAIKGSQDAVLLKYDSAGQLVYTRTLGAGVTASGMALSVASDGKVAIAGSVTGTLDQGDAGSDPNTSDSFVTLLDNQGQELWTDRNGASGADQAQAVAFDAGGNLYVAGKTQGSIGGGTAVGGWDGYLRAYDSTGHVLSTKQFGTVGDDSVAGIVVNGSNVLVAGQDGGAAVVRNIDISNPHQMTVTATRNLGGLGGGALLGIGLDGAGNVLLGGSTAANLNIGNTTIARGGALDGFAMKLSADLTSTASDAVAYYGGAGADKVSAATVANGQVWLTGSTTGALPGLTAQGKTDGFVAGIDVGAGAVTYSQRFTAKDQMDAPESIAVDANGGSALDRLGLPTGTLKSADSTLLTSISSVRDGDQFKIQVGNSSPVTVTVSASDTLSTLADKIRSAGMFEVNVSTTSTGSSTVLQIKPVNNRNNIQLLSGPAGRDALEALGINPGMVRNATVDKTKGVLPADKGTQIYGLHITQPLDLNHKADIKTAIDSIGNAITTVRAIYADLKQAATPRNPAAASGGKAPAYLQNRIADYTAALARLSGGGDASSGSSLASLIG
jgi:hypothetical protein